VPQAISNTRRTGTREKRSIAASKKSTSHAASSTAKAIS
jgi:hypothetical protein